MWADGSTVQISVLELRATGLTSVQKYRAIVKVNDTKMETSMSMATNEPRWHEMLGFTAPSALALNVNVEIYQTLLETEPNKFHGCCCVEVDVQSGAREFTCDLKNPEGLHVGQFAFRLSYSTLGPSEQSKAERISPVKVPKRQSIFGNLFFNKSVPNLSSRNIGNVDISKASEDIRSSLTPPLPSSSTDRSSNEQPNGSVVAPGPRKRTRSFVRPSFFSKKSDPIPPVPPVPVINQQQNTEIVVTRKTVKKKRSFPANLWTSKKTDPIPPLPINTFTPPKEPLPIPTMSPSPSPSPSPQPPSPQPAPKMLTTSQQKELPNPVTSTHPPDPEEAQNTERNMIQLRERINITKPAIGGMIQHTGAFGGALESLNVLFDVLGVVAQVHPVAQLTIGVATSIFNSLKNLPQQDEAILGISQKIEFSLAITRRLKPSDLVMEDINVLGDMLAAIERAVKLIEEYTHESFSARLLKSATPSKMRARIEECIQDLRGWDDKFQTTVLTKMYSKVSQMQEDTVAKEERDRARFDMSLLDRLPTAPHAMHDRVSTCLPGTRKELIAEILEWAADNSSEPIFWLRGPAGTGKSAIAATIAETMRNEGRLGGDFFFSQAITECREGSKVFTTIARNLAIRIPDVFREPISRAVEEEPDIGSMGISTQWKVLIKPLLKAIDHLPGDTRYVLVFDALDECESPLPLIESIASDIDFLPRTFKIFLTSRPEPQLKTAFRRLPVRDRILSADDPGIQEDIAKFVKERMDRIADVFELPAEWPGQHNCQQLVEKAGGLFIWVRTAATFVEDEYNDPNERLQLVLEDGGNQGTELDRLYVQVLEKAFLSGKVLQPGELERHRKVLGTIVTIRNPLGASAISTLIGLPSNSLNVVHLTARKIRAVLAVPDDEGDIKIIHQSFADFLTDRTRCTLESLLVDPEIQHQFLAKRCLELMDDFLTTFDCGKLDPSKLNSEMDDFESRLAKIPAVIQYACSCWGYHLYHAKPEEAHLNLVKTFYSKHLLCWLEVLSLGGYVRSGVESLRLALDWLEANCSENDIIALARDSHRFLKEFHYPIEHSVPHVRYSALLLTPRSSSVFKTYGNQILADSVQILFGEPVTWPAWHTVMDGHVGSVFSAAFSPLGDKIVSGSEDTTLRLWDPASGMPLGHKLTGHSDVVTTVVFEPEGEYAISGSMDKTLRRWNLASGETIGSFSGHEGGVTAVAIARDGKTVVSGSIDRSIRLWNIETGTQVMDPLTGHTDGVTSVTLSGCGKWVVSGSKDGTIRLWAAATGKAIEPILTDHEGPVRCVALSPDDKHIASGSEDRTILLWEANWAESSFKRTRILRGHAGTVHSVAFSSDGKSMVSGSLDATIRLWDLESGCIKNVLRATDDVKTVAFSPDDQSIMAALYDFSIRLWDVNSPITEKEGGASTVEGSPLSCNWSHDGKRLALGFTSGSIEVVDGKSYQPIVKRFRGHSGPVYSVSFSSDDRYVVSSSHDKIVRQWDASSGQELGKALVGHGKRVFCAAYSLDAKRIVSCSEDQTVRIWNAEDGTQIGDSIREDSYVYSVAYSPDGSYVAAGSDSALRIWDVQSHSMFAEVSKNTHWVTSVEYFPDGRHILATAIDGKPLYWSMEPDAPEDLDRFSRSILYDLDRGWLRDVDGRILCWLPSGYRNDFRPGVHGRHLLATPNVTLKEGFTIFDLSKALRGPKEGR